MKKFEGILFLSDIDGTLTNDDGQLPENNIRAIRYFQENGGLFTVASGRLPRFIGKFSGDFSPNTYIVGSNGTVIYDPEKEETVWAKELDPAVMQMISDTTARFPCISSLYFSDITGDVSVERKDFSRMAEKISAALDTPVCRAIVCQDAEDTPMVRRFLLDTYGDRYNFNCSWPGGVEIHAKGSGKGEVIPILKELLLKDGKPIHTVIAAGDFENDVTMLRTADIGYAAANATDLTKAAADRITVSNNEGVIASILKDIEGRIQTAFS